MIPLPWSHVGVALAAALAAGAAGWQARAVVADRDQAQLRQSFADERAAALAVAHAHAAERIERANRLLHRQTEIADAANLAASRRAADAAAAAVVADGLRERARELARAARAERCPAAVAGDGEAHGAAAADLLADVLASLEERGRRVAAEADARGDQLAECAARYEAVRAAVNLP